MPTTIPLLPLSQPSKGQLGAIHRYVALQQQALKTDRTRQRQSAAVYIKKLRHRAAKRAAERGYGSLLQTFLQQAIGWESEFHRRLEEIERQAILLALDVAYKTIGEHVAAFDEVVRHRLQEALAVFSGGEPPRIECSREDLERFRHWLGERELHAFELTPDPNLVRGSFSVSSRAGTCLFDWPQNFGELRTSILSQLKGGPSES
jgi:flagellar biosynthesis/type III secretory pathway protein FliH